jgi:hypothetical protein
MTNECRSRAKKVPKVQRFHIEGTAAADGVRRDVPPSPFEILLWQNWKQNQKEKIYWFSPNLKKFVKFFVCLYLRYFSLESHLQPNVYHHLEWKINKSKWRAALGLRLSEALSSLHKGKCTRLKYMNFFTPTPDFGTFRRFCNGTRQSCPRIKLLCVSHSNLFCLLSCVSKCIFFIGVVLKHDYKK